MTFRYLHIGISFGGLQKVTELEPTINAISRDWVRYTPTNWIIWTDNSIGLCSHALQAALSQLDQFLILELATAEKDGFHYQWVWNWLNSPRNPITGHVPGRSNVFADPPATLPFLASLTPPKR